MLLSRSNPRVLLESPNSQSKLALEEMIQNGLVTEYSILVRRPSVPDVPRNPWSSEDHLLVTEKKLTFVETQAVLRCWRRPSAQLSFLDMIQCDVCSCSFWMHPKAEQLIDSGGSADSFGSIALKQEEVKRKARAALL